MAQFIAPFVGMLPNKKMNHQELIRAIRMDIAAEQEAAHLYLAHAEATTNPLARKVLESIAEEEKIHIGEFTHLLNILTSGGEGRLYSKGAKEVNEMRRKKKMKGILDRAVKIGGL